MSGEEANAATAAAHLATLAALPPEVVTATALFSDGELASGRGAGAPVPRGARPSRRGDAAARAHRHRARRSRRCAAAARGGARPRARTTTRHASSTPGAARAPPAHRGPGAGRAAPGRRPGNRNYRAVQALTLRRPRAARAGHRHLPGSARRARRSRRSCTSRSRMRTKTLGRGAQAVAAYRAAAGVRPDYRRCLLEPRESQDLPLHPRRARTDAGGASRPGDRRGRPHPPVLRAGQGARGPRRVRRVLPVLQRGNALRRGASRYRPEILEQNTRAQIEVCTPELFRAARARAACGTATRSSSSDCRARARP